MLHKCHINHICLFTFASSSCRALHSCRRATTRARASLWYSLNQRLLMYVCKKHMVLASTALEASIKVHTNTFGTASSTGSAIAKEPRFSYLHNDSNAGIRSPAKGSSAKEHPKLEGAICGDIFSLWDLAKVFFRYPSTVHTKNVNTKPPPPPFTLEDGQLPANTSFPPEGGSSTRIVGSSVGRLWMSGIGDNSYI